MIRTANPALNESVFRNFMAAAGSSQMTLQGAALKTGVLLLIAVFAAFLTWIPMQGGDLQTGIILGGLGMIGGLLVAIVTAFKRDLSPVTAPLYAAFEGLFLGAISALYDMRYPGTHLVLNAVILTFGVLFTLLTAYVFRIIRATQNFRLGVASATGGIFLAYLVTFILSLFGIHVPYIHDSGPIGIGISLFVVVVAALNLVLDFDTIERGVEAGAPKFMEWYAGFALLVTLVWLYLEILRLLAKLQSRRD